MKITASATRSSLGRHVKRRVRSATEKKRTTRTWQDYTCTVTGSFLSTQRVLRFKSTTRQAQNKRSQLHIALVRSVGSVLLDVTAGHADLIVRKSRIISSWAVLNRCTHCRKLLRPKLPPFRSRCMWVFRWTPGEYNLDRSRREHPYTRRQAQEQWKPRFKSTPPTRRSRCS